MTWYGRCSGSLSLSLSRASMATLSSLLERGNACAVATGLNSALCVYVCMYVCMVLLDGPLDGLIVAV